MPENKTGHQDGCQCLLCTLGPRPGADHVSNLAAHAAAVKKQLREAERRDMAAVIYVQLVRDGYEDGMTQGYLKRCRRMAWEAADVWCEGKDGE